MVISISSFANEPGLSENEAKRILREHMSQWIREHVPTNIEYERFSDDIFFARYYKKGFMPPTRNTLIVESGGEVTSLWTDSLVNIHKEKFGSAENGNDINIIAESCIHYLNVDHIYQIISDVSNLPRHPDFPWDDTIMSNIVPPSIYINENQEKIYGLYTFNADYGGRISQFSFIFDEEGYLSYFEEKQLTELLPRKLR